MAAISDTYTLAEIRQGKGFYTTGWTVVLVSRRHADTYATIRREDGFDPRLWSIWGGGTLRADGTPGITRG